MRHKTITYCITCSMNHVANPSWRYKEPQKSLFSVFRINVREAGFLLASILATHALQAIITHWKFYIARISILSLCGIGNHFFGSRSPRILIHKSWAASQVGSTQTPELLAPVHIYSLRTTPNSSGHSVLFSRFYQTSCCCWIRKRIVGAPAHPFAIIMLSKSTTKACSLLAQSTSLPRAQPHPHKAPK